MITEAPVIEQHIIECPGKVTLLAAAGRVLSTCTADRAAVEEVTTTIETEVGTELGLPLQALQRLPHLTEVDLGIEAAEGTEGLALVSRL